MKNTRKKIRAVIYVAVGMVVMLTAIYLAIGMYFSGTFLAGHRLIRFVLYLADFTVCGGAIWFLVEGARYLRRHI